MGLTIKQEKFCMVYIETGNASEAYRQSYNCEKMKAESINRLAFDLLQNLKITSRLDELRQKHAERHNITVSDLIKELEETKNVALSAMIPQCSAAISATMGKAKLLGLDKGEHKEDDAKPQSQKIIIEVVDARKNAKTE